ncbi:MAG TPA: DUF2066 domain-containing protein, partial [Reyranella sp.]|nr:DUF2066 domain-containing protein [Reyranella sp.]
TSGNTVTIEGIDVDVGGADAIQARQAGIREARRKAARLLVERMVPPEERAKVPVLDEARLDAMVRGIEFTRERTATNRYVATLSVVFSAGPVKAWLNEAGIGLVETVPRPALVVPLWKGRYGLEPLDDPNAWRDAWATLDNVGTSVPVSVVRGDQLDQDAMSVEEAFVGDITALARLNARYRAPTIVVATVEGDPKAGPLSVGGLSYDTQTGARSNLPKLTVADSGKLPGAAKEMQAKLDEAWRGIATVQRDVEAAIDVVVPIRALGDWVQLRQRLGGIPSIKTVSVRQLEADRAELKLDYFGTAEQLQKTLGQAGLQLEKDADKWRLQVR